MIDSGGSIGTAIGSAIRQTRLRIGWSERELAGRLGVSQAEVQRLEAGGPSYLNVRLATEAMRLLGIRQVIDADPPGIADRVEQRDAVHARLCAYIARNLARSGWTARAEIEIGEGRFRGWIDLLAYRAEDRSLLCIEVKSTMVDTGRTLRSLGWYARSARPAASHFGWRPRVVLPVLLVLATVESDARLASQQDLIRTRLPGGASELLQWIRSPAAAVPEPSVALVDPLSRRREWLIRTRSHGRRSALPFADSREAGRHLR
ncbi:MAG TPA: helix-turn-helix domain-containing protein [Candidatus Limnocylindrales bacterium]